MYTHPSRNTNLHSSKVDSTSNANTNHSPSRSNNLLIAELLSEIPGQMSKSVETMESKRHSNQKLSCNLSSYWPRGECGSHGGRGQVPAQKRSNKVCGTEGVHASRENTTSDTVKGRKVPCHLWLVDCQMWRGRTVLALRDEDLVGIGRSHLLSCYWST